MFRNATPFLKINLFLALILSLTFYACQPEESLKVPAETIDQSVFEKHSTAQSQFINVSDQGEGKYTAYGEQGTIISIDDALVNANGDKVRGEIQIELKEIYSVTDMILNRKQTVADYDGVQQILESGGELYIDITQNGEQLSIAADKELEVLLPSENSGGAKDNMELFYGEEVGEQIIWHPTGTPVRVLQDASRNSEYYQLFVGVLGWVNVDVIWGAGGDEVECIEVKVDCEELCQPNKTYVFMNVPGVNTGVEFDNLGNGNFQFCGIPGEPALPLGGVPVTFIVIVDCLDGTLMVATVNAVITPGNHFELIRCDKFQQIHASELEDFISQL